MFIFLGGIPMPLKLGHEATQHKISVPNFKKLVKKLMSLYQGNAFNSFEE